MTINLFGVLLYICALFTLWPDNVLPQNEPEDTRSIIVSLIATILVFLFTWIWFVILLKTGEYRPGSKKEELRGRVEVKSLLVPAIIFGTSIV